MAEKEERILVAKLGGRNCPVETNDNICLLGCSCESCNGGVSRQEAIERMAMAMFEWQRPGSGGDVPIEDVWQNEKCGFENLAEAALNALFEVDK